MCSANPPAPGSNPASSSAPVWKAPGAPSSPTPAAPSAAPTPAPTSGIDYSSYIGNKSPMDAYMRNANGLPVGWDWDEYSRVTGVQTKAPDGRPLDNTGRPIDFTFEQARPGNYNGSGINPAANAPGPAVTPPPSTPTTRPEAPVTAGPLTVRPDPGPSQVTPQAPPPVTGEPSGYVPGSGTPGGGPFGNTPTAPDAGGTYTASDTLPVVQQAQQYAVPLPKVFAPTLASGTRPQGNEAVVGALMKRFRPNGWY